MVHQYVAVFQRGKKRGRRERGSIGIEEEGKRGSGGGRKKEMEKEKKQQQRSIGSGRTIVAVAMLNARRGHVLF